MGLLLSKNAEARTHLAAHEARNERPIGSWKNWCVSPQGLELRVIPKLNVFSFRWCPNSCGYSTIQQVNLRNHMKTCWKHCNHTPSEDLGIDPSQAGTIAHPEETLPTCSSRLIGLNALHISSQDTHDPSPSQQVDDQKTTPPSGPSLSFPYLHPAPRAQRRTSEVTLSRSQQTDDMQKAAAKSDIHKATDTPAQLASPRSNVDASSDIQHHTGKRSDSRAFAAESQFMVSRVPTQSKTESYFVDTWYFQEAFYQTTTAPANKSSL